MAPQLASKLRVAVPDIEDAAELACLEGESAIGIASERSSRRSKVIEGDRLIIELCLREKPSSAPPLNCL